jgi:DNA-binding transcriptional regulator YdaS (Cro superfamily)
MKFQQIVKHFGSQVAAAGAIGCSQPTLSNWKKRGRIPQLQQLRIEMVTQGKLKAQPLLTIKMRKILSRA